jgi:hypothetical protein
MNTEVKKENKFLVIKRESLDEYFSQFRSGIFATAKEAGVINRIPFVKVVNDLKNENKYIICNQDEPYAEAVWQVILEGERKKQEVKKP